MMGSMKAVLEGWERRAHVGFETPLSRIGSDLLQAFALSIDRDETFKRRGKETVLEAQRGSGVNHVEDR